MSNAVLTGKGESVARWRESDRMDPATARTTIFTADSVERELLSPNRGRWPIPNKKGNTSERQSITTIDKTSPLIHIFDVRRKYTGFHVRATSGEEDVVGVPIDGQDGRSDWLLEQPRDPPIALGVERADSNRTLRKSIIHE